ncbi:hypothetical protein SAMN05660473_03461 [Arthrobacter sp. 49Tsu3.1M3]|nr:hypothetical protein SAMN05660473_03461 [Arthrobacter sp. 49Tsu3.1M3]
MAGIAAMLLAGIFGTAMGLNNTATYLASGVAFVAVSLWVDSRISRRRSAAGNSGAGQDLGQDAGLDAKPALDADPSKRDG